MDAVTLQVMGSAMRAIAEEMEAALAKSMGVDWGTYLVALEKSMKE